MPIKVSPLYRVKNIIGLSEKAVSTIEREVSPSYQDEDGEEYLYNFDAVLEWIEFLIKSKESRLSENMNTEDYENVFNELSTLKQKMKSAQYFRID